MNKNNKIKIIASMIAMLGVGNAIAQNNVTSKFDTTAKIERFCSINANEINFGIVRLPLTAQSANAQMNILCSNNTPYTVDLSYADNFMDVSDSSSSAGYIVSMAYKWTEFYESLVGYGSSGYRVYKDGVPIGSGTPSSNKSNSIYDYNINGDMNLGDFSCNGKTKDSILFRTKDAADLLYPGAKLNTWVSDKKGICSSGSAGRANMDNWNAVAATLGGKISDKGSMIGTFKGDQLAYQITLPNDSTKSWIAKVNSYTATSSGTNRVVNMNANIALISLLILTWILLSLMSPSKRKSVDSLN